MFCKNCGKEIDDDSKFCQHCGAVIDNEKVEVEEVVSVEPSELTPNRKTAITLTIIVGLFGLLVLIFSLLNGRGLIFFITSFVWLFLYIRLRASYNKIEITEKDTQAFTNHYREKIKNFDSKPEGFKAQYTFKSPSDVTGVNRLNVFLTNAKKMWVVFFYILAIAGGIISIAFGASGFAGAAANIDGVYVQSVSHGSSNGVGQAGKTAYKVEGNYIYYSGYYDGDNTGWSGPYTYNRFGNRVTYRFTSGGMDSTHTLYFVNFGTGISGDAFGFNVAYNKVS